MLHGVRWSRLDLREKIDVAFAALLEAELSGAWVSIDKAIDDLNASIAKVLPDEESWGLGPDAEMQQARAASFFGEDARYDQEGNLRPVRRRPRKPVGTGNPLADALASTLRAQWQASVDRALSERLS